MVMVGNGGCWSILMGFMGELLMMVVVVVVFLVVVFFFFFLAAMAVGGESGWLL